MNSVFYSQDPQALLENSLDVTHLTLPGLYIIYNRPLDLVYVGEAQNLMGRLGDHASRLSRGTHACKQLQRDFTRAQGHGFRFLIVRSGVDMQDVDRRRIVEGELLYLYEGKTYNTSGLNRIKNYFKQAVKINMQRFETMFLAAEAHGLSLEMLHLRLLDKTDTSCVFDVNTPGRGYTNATHEESPTVVWDKQEQAYRYFRTTTTAAHANMLSRQVVKRRADSKTNMSIRWWSELTDQEQGQVLDRPKSGAKADVGKALVVRNPSREALVFYPSVQAASDALDLGPDELKARADDPDNVDAWWVLNAVGESFGHALVLKEGSKPNVAPLPGAKAVGYRYYPSILAAWKATKLNRRALKRWATQPKNDFAVWVVDKHDVLDNV